MAATRFFPLLFDRLVTRRVVQLVRKPVVRDGQTVSPADQRGLIFQRRGCYVGSLRQESRKNESFQNGVRANWICSAVPNGADVVGKHASVERVTDVLSNPIRQPDGMQTQCLRS